MFLFTVNVALNKPVYQQSPYEPAYFKPDDDLYISDGSGDKSSGDIMDVIADGSKAVDGRKSDLNRDGDQCAVSYVSQTATLWVNLSSVHSINHITIYFRTDNDLQSIVTFYYLNVNPRITFSLKLKLYLYLLNTSILFDNHLFLFDV